MIKGARILERLDATGISQAELARRVGLSQPTIFNLIHRAKKGSTKLHLIARELGTTPAYLSGETDNPGTNDTVPAKLNAETREILAGLATLCPADRRAIAQIVRTMAGAVDRDGGLVSAPIALHDNQTSFKGEADVQ